MMLLIERACFLTADSEIVKFVIPGNIEEKRKDYIMILNIFEKIFLSYSNVSLSLLGRPLGEYGEMVIDKCNNLKEKGYKVNYYNFFKVEQPCSDKSNKSEEISLPTDIHHGILNCISLCKYDELNMYIDNFVDYLKSVKNMDYVLKLCFMLITTIENEFQNKGITHTNLYKEIEKIYDVDELKKYINTICFSIIEYTSESFETENVYVSKAEDFIKNHYAENIGVTNVSDFLNISYPYLSKLFKHYTQLNIMDYINKVRIDAAKELLSTTEMTIIEISAKVGYNNNQSFQRYFKKFVDLTPGEYRKINTYKSI